MSTITKTPARGADRPAARRARRPVPISHFSIPLGLAGLGGAWSAAAQLLGASAVPAELAYAAALVLWTAFIFAYVVSTVRNESDSFHLDLRHPLTDPLTAYIPVIAILLITHYAAELGAPARWLCYAAVAALAINAAAVASFWVGIYFWLLLGAVITGRLLFGSPLPQPFRPVLSILLSPPAVASLAWFVIADRRLDDVQAAVGGVTVFMLLIQLFFLSGYLRLPFTATHWVFTFPLAVLGNIGIRWAATLQFGGWEVAAWVVLGISTGSILAIVAGTVREVARWSGRRFSERAMARTQGRRMLR
jgi:tellurite resistance protein